MIPIDLIS